MRRAFHLLLALTVLWCGLHLGEAVVSPAGASDEAHFLSATADDHDHDRPGDKSSGSAHACHHHCPVAPEASPGRAGDAFAWTAPPHHPASIAAMRSRATSPLLEPPAA